MKQLIKASKAIRMSNFLSNVLLEGNLLW